EGGGGGRRVAPRGIAEVGPPGGIWGGGTLEAARLHGLRHDALTAAELMRRFPAFRGPPEHVAVVQPDGGFLDVEPSIAAQIALATAAGAEIRRGEAVRAMEPRAGLVRIISERGVVEAGAAIVAAGAWTPTLLPELAPMLRATREVVGWFEVADADLFAAGRCPVFILESRHGMHYGIPPRGG